MNLGSILKELLTAAKTDEEKVLLPLVATAANNLATNPTAANGVAQGALLFSGVIAAQPNVGQDILKDLASVINTEVQSIVNAAPVVAAATAAPKS